MPDNQTSLQILPNSSLEVFTEVQESSQLEIVKGLVSCGMAKVELIYTYGLLSTGWELRLYNELPKVV